MYTVHIEKSTGSFFQKKKKDKLSYATNGQASLVTSIQKDAIAKENKR